MKKRVSIKTINEEWKNRCFILGSVFLLVSFLFVAYLINASNQELKKEEALNQTKTSLIETGRNSTLNYIISNKVYPTKYKGAVIWLNKFELCEED